MCKTRAPFKFGSGAQSVCLKDKVYVRQGYNPYHYSVSDIGQRSTARLYIYALATDTWGTLDTPVYNFALTTYCSKLVLVGGREYVGEKVEGRPSNKLWTLNVDGEWEETLPPMETACIDAYAVSHRGHLLIMDHDCNEVHVYNNRHWSKAQYLPEKLKRVKSIVFKGDLYVINDERFESGKVYYTSLDSLIASSQSSETSQTSTCLNRVCPAMLGERIVVFGDNDIHAYSPLKQSWVEVAEKSKFFTYASINVMNLSSNELIVFSGHYVSKVTLNSKLYNMSIIKQYLFIGQKRYMV